MRRPRVVVSELRGREVRRGDLGQAIHHIVSVAGRVVQRVHGGKAVAAPVVGKRGRVVLRVGYGRNQARRGVSQGGRVPLGVGDLGQLTQGVVLEVGGKAGARAARRRRGGGKQVAVRVIHIRGDVSSRVGGRQHFLERVVSVGPRQGCTRVEVLGFGEDVPHRVVGVRGSVIQSVGGGQQVPKRVVSQGGIAPAAAACATRTRNRSSQNCVR